jgi:hypothetical protein
VNLPHCVDDDLIRAWGPGGTWSAEKGGVFAPEEVCKNQDFVTVY